MRSVAYARRILIALTIAVAMLAATALAPPVLLPGVAQAQEAQPQQRGLLRFLFRRNDPQPRVQEVPSTSTQQPAQQRRQQRSTSGGGHSVASAPAPVAVEKSEDATHILVIGDFLAGGLADGLETAFAENADVVVTGRANGSSGFVRDDHYDWPGRIGEVLEAQEPDIVVLMIGSNDRQQMRVEGTREQPLSEAWLKEYEARATALASAIREKDLPLIWVGNLPFRSGAMSSDMLAFNDIYRRVVSNVGGEFVDVWDGFVDENGAFATSGPDMNGQPAQLRASDGINVTAAGRRKIAFYVEKPLNRLLGGSAATGLARIAPDQLGTMPEEEPQDVTRIERTVPVSLSDADLQGGTELLGAAPAPKTEEPRTIGERLVREGVAPQPRPGRADDFGGVAPKAEEDDEDADRTASVPDERRAGPTARR